MLGLVKSILVSTFDKTDEASLIIIILYCGICKILTYSNTEKLRNSIQITDNYLIFLE